MPQPPDQHKLHAELQALRAERDAAVQALERLQAEGNEGMKLLVEEQDRFVSRLIEGHDRETVRLRLELDEARTNAQRYEQKADKERARAVRLEEDLGRIRADVDRIRDQRDTFRAELRKTQQTVLNLQAGTERLDADLRLARAMLDDAMGGDAAPVWQSAKPPTQQHEISRPPRESGIVNRRERPPRVRVSTPPGRRSSAPAGRRSDVPRAAVGADSVDEGPPSSR